MVVELGPGSSFGVGLAALLSGAEKYRALDATRIASRPRNQEVFDELVGLFRRRECIPDESEFPRVKPTPRSFAFPTQLLPDDLLRKTLDEGRLESIRASLRDVGTSGMITHAAPWVGSSLVEAGSADFVLSQAVLEYVEDLADTYQMMFTWLRPGGFVSHEIDLSSHGMTKTWDGHWSYSQLAWKLVKGRRPYFLNRQPHSTHIRLLSEAGFTLICDVRMHAEPALNREQLARPFRDLGTEDLNTRSVFVQAVKRVN
ncbi:MAG: methyltransferase domain-containing protein [candidate division WOR-3 bacterium]|nr:methyltransferase domain-containing protein [candidate division WOR-3 bacterium]